MEESVVRRWSDMSDEDRLSVVSLRVDLGWSASRIASEYSTHRNKITMFCRKNGVKLANRHEASRLDNRLSGQRAVWYSMSLEVRREAIRAGVESGKTARNIGVEYGVRKNTITNFASWNGIKLMSAKEACRVACAKNKGGPYNREDDIDLSKFEHNVRSFVIEPGQNPWNDSRKKENESEW